MIEDSASEAVIALRLRMKAIEAEMDDISKQINTLRTQHDRLYRLNQALINALAEEEALLAEPDEAEIPELHPTGGKNLSDLLLDTLKSGPRTLEQLKEIGRRWAPLQESNFPGRALNFALVGLQKGHHVERLKNGAWQLASGEGQK